MYYAFIPANAKYVMINYYTNFGFFIYVDDIEIGEIPNYDASITNIPLPLANSHNLTNNEMVTATVTNYGALPITNFSLDLIVDGTLVINSAPFTSATPIGTFESADFQIGPVNLSVFGQHTIEVKINLSGDAELSNDNFIKTIDNQNCIITTFPWSYGFDSSTLDQCWTLYNADGDATNWALVDFPHSGTGALFHDYEDWGNQDGWIITPKMALSSTNNYKLSFWSYNIYSSDYGKNSVLVSTTGNTANLNDWTEIWTVSSVPERTWELVEVQIPATYAGQSIYIAFRYEGANSHIWLIDEVGVSVVHNNDASITDIPYPSVNSQNLTNSEMLTITVKNNGILPITNFSLNMSLDGGSWTTMSYAPVTPIASLTSADFQFGPVDLSAFGTHTIDVSVNLPGDAEPSNDDFSKTIINLDCLVATYPWTYGFETSQIDPCWFLYNADGYEPNWALVNFSHTGSTALYHDFGMVNQDGWIVSPRIALPATGVYKFSFWSYNVYSSDYGKNSVLISTTGNTANLSDWMEIWTVPSVMEETWELNEAQIPSTYLGQNIYIAFRYEGFFAHIWVIDDVGISEIPAHDAALFEIKNPVSGPNYTAAEPLVVSIRNNGHEILDNFTIKFSVNGSQAASEDVTGFNLQALGTSDYTFTTQQVDMSAVGTYNIAVDIDLSGDANITDNHIEKVVQNYNCLVDLPWVEDFENTDPEYEQCWSLIDNDGDGYNWWLVPGFPEYAHSGDNFMVSESYDGSYPLYPDNYMVLPPFEAHTDGTDITFWVAALEPAFPYENYKVMVSTTRPIVGNFVSLFEETLVDDQWHEVVVHLDGAIYGGQQVFVAIVHTNCTDQYMIRVDDISIAAASKPVLNDFIIEKGAAVTPYRTVKFDAIYSDAIPTEYMISEDPNFNNAVWTSMTNVHLYTFDSDENGLKTVYLKLRNNYGESNVLSDDIYYKRGAIKVTDYAINGGDDITTQRAVILNNTVIDGTPAYYSASENIDMIGAEWLPYNSEPAFTLSEGNEVKTVYFAVTDTSKENISNIVSDNIILDQSETVEHHGLNVKLDPNPVENEINVLIENELLSKVQVNIYTTMGQMCHIGEYESKYFTINLNSCPSGILLVKLSSGDKYVVKRIIKL
jgi:hypothetical protein